MSINQNAINKTKKVNESAKKILVEIIKLSKDLQELSRYSKNDATQQNTFSDSYKLKTASSEFIRFDRKLAIIQPVLKALITAKYPEIEIEENIEEESEPVDKTPHSKNYSIITTVSEEEEDGEEAR